MRIYWYWPTPHLCQHPWPGATTRPGDVMVVHSLEPPPNVVPDSVHGYELKRTLPQPARDLKARTFRWAGNRAHVYWRRALIRERHVSSRNYDVCHIHHINILTDWWAIPRLRKHAKVVLTVHDVIPHVRRMPAAMEDALLRRAYQAADGLVVYHGSLKSELVSRFCVDESSIHTIAHPVRNAAGRNSTEGAVRTVLFFGTFRSNKGIDVWLDAIERMRDREKLRFIFAGRGDEGIEHRVRRAADQDGRISYEIGRIENDRRDELMSSASLVVLPYTDFHSQSGVLADAYALSRPVVVTDVGALGDSVRADGSGWVARPGDAQDLALTVTRALEDRPARRAAAAAAGRAGAKRSYPAVGRELRDVYDAVAGASASMAKSDRS